MEFIDTHSHLFLEEFKEDLPEVIERAKSIGVSKVFMPNIDNSTISDMLRVASQYAGYCYPMIGLHPTSVDENYEIELKQMKEMLDLSNNFVGIGEVGLDLYWDKTYRMQQESAFVTQLQWAIEYKLPLIIHCREAFDELYALMFPYIEDTNLRGIFHSFTGTKAEADKLLSFKNFKLGINGVVTFKKTILPDVLKDVPINRIVLETDSPYLTPVPNRGKRNESANVKDVLNKLAEIYEISSEKMAELTNKNALEVFKVTE